MIIRFCDCIISIVGLIALIPFFIIVSILIVLTSTGGVFFIQERVGKDGKIFRLIKFRSMVVCYNPSSLLTIGEDSRITPVGRVLRRYKFDELPQLLNVLKGEMSIVGPRPEMKKYVDLYTDEQKIVLSMRPGLTDYASINFFNENELLVKSKNPEETYINQIMPQKIKLNTIYVNNPSVNNYFRVILLTIKRIF